MMLEFGEELAGADFGDLRLTKRSMRILGELGNKANLSIPAAFDNRAEMESWHCIHNEWKQQGFLQRR